MKRVNVKPALEEWFVVSLARKNNWETGRVRVHVYGPYTQYEARQIKKHMIEDFDHETGRLDVRVTRAIKAGR